MVREPERDDYPSYAAQASRQAAAAAARAGTEIRVLSGHAQLHEAGRFLGRVWSSPATDSPVPDDVLVALSLSGNFLAGAFGGGGALLGVSVGWMAVAEHRELHSHVTGVEADRRHSGVGRALKLYQRAWALGRGIGVVSWTFDPLVRSNAVFNLRRLGARAEAYVENVYGEMQDVLNAGDESDRLLVRWHLLDDAVVKAADGIPAEPHPSGVGAVSVVPTPEDIVAIRREGSGESTKWRLELRHALGDAMVAGWKVLGLDGSGSYVLEEAMST